MLPMLLGWDGTSHRPLESEDAQPLWPILLPPVAVGLAEVLERVALPESQALLGH